MSTPYAKLEPGTLLIASHEIEDELYNRSVVLLCDHSPVGSFGLIINKEVDEGAQPLNMSDTANPNVFLRQGGPLQPDQLMLLSTQEPSGDEMLEVAPGITLGGSLQFLEASLQNATGSPLLLCFGYGAWGSGQLEEEFLEGGWYLTPATPDLLFQTTPGSIWKKALASLQGPSSSLAAMPKNLYLN